MDTGKSHIFSNEHGSYRPEWIEAANTAWLSLMATTAHQGADSFIPEETLLFVLLSRFVHELFEDKALRHAALREFEQRLPQSIPLSEKKAG